MSVALQRKAPPQLHSVVCTGPLQHRLPALGVEHHRHSSLPLTSPGTSSEHISSGIGTASAVHVLAAVAVHTWNVLESTSDNLSSTQCLLQLGAQHLHHLREGEVGIGAWPHEACDNILSIGFAAGPGHGLKQKVRASGLTPNCRICGRKFFRAQRSSRNAVTRLAWLSYQAGRRSSQTSLWPQRDMMRCHILRAPSPSDLSAR